MKKTVRSIYHIASFLITMVFQEAQLNLLAYYEYSTIMQICLECHSDIALILLKGRFGDFTSFSTVFQAYQDDGQRQQILKGFVWLFWV